MIGGAGFMGSAVVERLAERGHEVLVYDALSYAGRLENIAHVLDRVEFVKGDVRDRALLERTIDRFRPEVVVNLAAQTHVDRSIVDPRPFIDVNVYGVYTVLEVLKERRILYVHISTDEVYGDLWGGGYATEESCLRPSNPYSATKASGDMLILAYGRTYRLPYIILRPCNNYGPRQHPEKLIPRTIIRLLLGLPAVIYGDGRQVRDWLYVYDFAEAVETVLEKGEEGSIYNICAENYAEVREIVERIVRLLGRDPAEWIRYAPERPGEDRRYAMRCERLKSLGWRPRTSLDEGLRATIEWYRSNRWWWEPILRQPDAERFVLSETPW